MEENGKTKEQVMDKLKKLLSLANDAGASENEINLAMEHSVKLINKYNLDPELITSIKEKTTTVIKQVVPSMSDKKVDWESILFAVMAEVFECQTVRTHELNGRFSFSFFGFSRDVDLAVHFFIFLRRTVHKKSEMYAKSQAYGREGTAAYRSRLNKIIDAYAQGITVTIARRLQEMFVKRTQTATSEGKELMVLKESEIEKVIIENFPELTKARPLKKIDYSVFEQGKEEGHNIALSKPIKE